MCVVSFLLHLLIHNTTMNTPDSELLVELFVVYVTSEHNELICVSLQLFNGIY